MVTPPKQTFTLSLHDALPICVQSLDDLAQLRVLVHGLAIQQDPDQVHDLGQDEARDQCGECEQRSEEHTSELQSRRDLVCRLLLEKKNAYTLSYMSVNRRMQS